MRIAAIALLAICAACDRRAPEPRPAPSLSLAAALGGDVDGFERAVEPREFRFPEDHGAHPDFRTEWWYVTGNLEGRDAERYGFHFTLFRTALAPGAPQDRTSRFATNEVWMGHFAITDARAGRMIAAERFARGAVGLGGASIDPLAIRVDGWRLDGITGLGEERMPTFRIGARDGPLAIDLDLVATKPLVLQGEDGLSRKGSGEGSASYYYAVTRLDARGQIEIDGRRRDVHGSAWLDREWSTSLLEESQVGWDWFALQLDDGTDLMLYRMRTEVDGVSDIDPSSHGAWIEPDGTKHHLALGDYDARPTSTWTSPATGAVYPSTWRIRARHPRTGEALELTATPLIADQELRLTVTYWEGAIVLSGELGGRAIEGRGYAELTGYAAR